MALSKPMYSLLGFYFEQLYLHPVLTKSITACILATGANYISQKLSSDQIDSNSLFAYGAFGLVFGGSVPHYFYGFIEKITKEMRNKKALQFLMQRILFTPVYTALSLYFLTILEGGNPQQAIMNLMALYKKVLVANWTYLSLPVYINFKYIHPMVSHRNFFNPNITTYKCTVSLFFVLIEFRIYNQNISL